MTAMADTQLLTAFLKYASARSRPQTNGVDAGEFWRVVNGDGPCNRERLAARGQLSLTTKCPTLSPSPLEAGPKSWLRWASVWVLKVPKRMFH